jgi:molybdopterin-containing oxidoreductase family membrane subunit
MVMGLLLLDILFQISEYLIAYRGGIPDHIAGMKIVMWGKFWWVFWIGQILIGTAIPFYLLTKHSQKAKSVAIAGLLIAVGFFSVRWNIVVPGLATEEIRGITTAYDSVRLTANYFPSITEWLVLFGIIGLGLLLFGLGEKFLPREKEI